MTEQVPDTFRAFRIHNDEDGYRAGVESISLVDLDEGDVTIRVRHSEHQFQGRAGRHRQRQNPAALSHVWRHRRSRHGGRLNIRCFQCPARRCW